jgi:signal peptidase I
MMRLKFRQLVVRCWKEWWLTICLILFLVVPIKSSLADLNWVPSGSMNPTILEGDFVFVNKAAYDLRIPLTLQRLAKWANPERGDIVICFSPDDGTRLIKRVIGLPGDTLEMHKNRLVINGQYASQSRMDSQHLKHLVAELRDHRLFAMERLDNRDHPIMSNPRVRALRSFGPITIPAGHYFMMGDNRDNSRDSRMFGLVRRDAVVGKAVGIVGSFDIKDKCQPRISRFFSELD